MRPPHQWDDNDAGPSGGAASGKKDTGKDGNIGGPVEDL